MHKTMKCRILHTTVDFFYYVLVNSLHWKWTLVSPHPGFWVNVGRYHTRSRSPVERVWHLFALNVKWHPLCANSCHQSHNGGPKNELSNAVPCCWDKSGPVCYKKKNKGKKEMSFSLLRLPFFCPPYLFPQVLRLDRKNLASAVSSMSLYAMILYTVKCLIYSVLKLIMIVLWYNRMWWLTQILFDIKFAKKNTTSIAS